MPKWKHQNLLIFRQPSIFWPSYSWCHNGGWRMDFRYSAVREDIVMNLESLVIYFGAFHLLDPWEYGLQTLILMFISSAEIGLTLCHLSILEDDAPVELLRDAVFYSENFPTCSKFNFASTVTESGKPRRDLSTIAWKSLYKFAVTRTPRATWVPIFRFAAMLKRCSEMRLAGETVIMDLWSQYTRNPKCLITGSVWCRQCLCHGSRVQTRSFRLKSLFSIRT